MANWLISGSRDFPDEALARSVFRAQFKKGDVVFCGGARGIDLQAEEEARSITGVKVKLFIPKWNTEGKSAGIKRNVRMFDAWKTTKNKRALVLWDGESHGTLHMLKLVEEVGAPLTLVRVSYG